MPDVNTGQRIRFPFGILRIITDPDGTPTSYDIKGLNHGEVSIREGGRATRAEMEGDDFNGDIYRGSASESEASIVFRVGSTSYDTDDVYQLLRRPVVNGKVDTISLVFIRPDYDGATTGKQLTLTDCYDPAGAFEHAMAGGGDAAADTVRATMRSASPFADITDWTAS